MKTTLKIADITKVATKVSEMYQAGKRDNEISKTMGLPEVHVLSVRRMLGLMWSHRSSVFSNFRKLVYDNNSEKFVISSSQVPHEIAEQLGLKAGGSYEYMAFVEKKGVIRLEISPKVD